MTEPQTEHAPSHLMDFLLAALVPIFTAGSLTDIQHARLAAQEAIAAYTVRGQQKLVTIAQIVAFALAALDTLRLSMPAELPLSMKLKLRANANALNRAARDNTQTLEKAWRTSMPLETSLAEQAAMAASVEAAWQEPPRKETATPQNATDIARPTDIVPIVQDATPIAKPDTLSATEHQNRLHWASAMKTAAARLQAREAIVLPAQQKADRLWIDALTGVAGDLTGGKGPIGTSGRCKADLLRTTLMAGDPGFSAHLSNGVKRACR